MKVAKRIIKVKAANFVLMGVLLVLLYLCILIFLWRMDAIHWAETPSLQYGFYVPTIRREIAKGDYVVFSINDNIRESYRSITGADMKCDNLIKKVERIEDGECYVRGDSKEEIEARTGEKGLRSFDSGDFGTIPIADCRRVGYALPISSKLMLWLIRLYEKFDIKKESIMEKNEKQITVIEITGDEFNKHMKLVLSNMDDESDVSEEEVNELLGKKEGQQ